MRLKPVLASIAVATAMPALFLKFVATLPGNSLAGPMPVPPISMLADQNLLHPIAGKPLSTKKSKQFPKVMPSWPEPKVVFARPRLDVTDELATLRALQLALNEVGDGSTYVWHRKNGRLSGIVKPTASFRDNKGLICRHIVVWLTSGSVTKKTETIACRQSDRVWTLEG